MEDLKDLLFHTGALITSGDAANGETQKWKFLF